MLNNNYGKQLVFKNNFNGKRLYVTCLKTSVMSSLTGDNGSTYPLLQPVTLLKYMKEIERHTMGNWKRKDFVDPPSPLGPQGPQTTEPLHLKNG